jgi:hypothetical protein
MKDVFSPLEKIARQFNTELDVAFHNLILVGGVSAFAARIPSTAEDSPVQIQAASSYQNNAPDEMGGK